MKRVAASVFLILLGACDKPPPPPSAPPAAPEPALPPLGEVRFPTLTDADSGTFTEIPTPEGVLPLRWDFSAGRKYAYEFSQTLNQVLVTAKGGERRVTRSRERNRGRFTFAAGEGKTAAAVINIKTEEAVVDGAPLPQETIDKNPPSHFECAVGEDGLPQGIRQREGEADARIYFEALLPLDEGERPVKDGRIATRRAGWFLVDGLECARLETEFEFTPKSTLGVTLMRGRTVAYFAFRERCFVRAGTAIAQGTRVRIRDEKGAWTTSAVDWETTFSLRRKN